MYTVVTQLSNTQCTVHSVPTTTCLLISLDLHGNLRVCLVSIPVGVAASKLNILCCHFLDYWQAVIGTH